MPRIVVMRLPGPFDSGDPLGKINLDPDGQDYPYTGPDVLTECVVVEDKGGVNKTLSVYNAVLRSQTEVIDVDYDKDLTVPFTWKYASQLQEPSRQVIDDYITNNLIASTDDMVADLSAALQAAGQPGSDHVTGLTAVTDAIDDNQTVAGLPGLRDRVNGLAGLLGLLIFSIIDRESVEDD